MAYLLHFITFARDGYASIGRSHLIVKFISFDSTLL